MNHFLQTLKHRFIIAHGLGHAAGQTVAQGVIDVKFAGRARSQEGIVKTLMELAKSYSFLVIFLPTSLPYAAASVSRTESAFLNVPTLSDLW